MSPENKRSHIVLTKPPDSSLYTSTSTGGGDKTAPVRDRIPHGQYLTQKLSSAWQQSVDEQAVKHSTRSGVYLEFKSDQGHALELTSLENLTKRIRLLNVREKSEQGIMYATVFVPHKEKSYFVKKLESYVKENTNKGKPKNAQLVNSVADIRKALLVRSFWSDQEELIPDKNPVWVEVWLSSHASDVIDGFEGLLKQQEIETRTGVIKFPERVVKVIFANQSQLAQLTELSDYIAEYRKAKTTANYWVETSNSEQAGWVENILERSSFDGATQSSVCILDTGINNGHPLINPILKSTDCQSYNSTWGVDDHNKHGTLMAGVAAYGDLTEVLESNEKVMLNHHLESVKILPPPPAVNEAYLWGHVVSQAISLAEIQAPERNRTICMAVTADDTRDQGRPSSWSAQLDQVTSGADDNTQRLMIVSAGNTTSNVKDAAQLYPNTQLTDSVHDPAQSWNALAVGAYTELVDIGDVSLSGYSTVAPKNGLSPFTTTSATWEENKWPIKPELVLEGGNLAVDETGFATECDDLSVLSTYYDPQTAHFSTFSMTSVATARLGWMAGKLQAEFPDFWPETIRGLLVHSSTWPEALKKQFIDDESKTSYKYLLSVCGYGVPDLDRAMYSALNSLTLIVQSHLQPFDKKPKGSSGYRTRDMHLHELPWPKDVLLNLPDNTPVEMRVTLSYFIEPGPGEVGWKDRYRYASHALRFDLNSPGESKPEFSKRINKAARDSDEGSPGTKSPSDHWLLGSQARNRGSIHSDIWQGSAADLAGSNMIAISPTIGWWRERNHLGRWNRKTRYSLLISIYTPDESVDIYTPVAIQLEIPVAVDINV